MTQGLPNSAGTAPPLLTVPAFACDSHMHVYDQRFAHTGKLVERATAEDYRSIQQRLGTQRAVVVTPRNYGTNNGVTLDAIAQLGIDRTRGVAVVHPDVSDSQLAALHDGGVRGIRFTLYTPQQAATNFDMVEPLAARVQAFGWHVQLHWTADQIVEHEALLMRLPCPMVFDHRARLGTADAEHPAFGVVATLLEAGRAWVKLSGAYLDAPAPYTALDGTASRWARLAPERLVWGSDWPHSTEALHKPDDAHLLDLLGRWVPDDAMRRRVLVDNPAVLYDFPPPKNSETH